jgi:hypothetical protein
MENIIFANHPDRSPTQQTWGIELEHAGGMNFIGWDLIGHLERNQNACYAGGLQLIEKLRK